MIWQIFWLSLLLNTFPLMRSTVVCRFNFWDRLVGSG